MAAQAPSRRQQRYQQRQQRRSSDAGPRLSNSKPTADANSSKMPSFSGTTPESMLARSDSLNPEKTCKGYTTNGKACRRPVSPTGPPRKNGKNLAPSSGDDDGEDSYCWQHKDQAGRSRKSSSAPRPSPYGGGIAEGRSSLDTLADRLGLVDLNSRPGRYDPEKRYGDERPRPKTSTFCFCFSVPEEDFDEPPRPAQPRPQPHPVQHGRPSTSSARPSHHQGQSRPTTSSAPTAGHLKSLIPDSLDAVTTSALMTEVAKPPSDADEPGYIYMFWLTPESAAEPAPVDAARDLLAPPPRGGNRSRSPSDVVSAFANQNKNSRDPKPKTMLLKIGRAANVQRRMNQWSRQCGHSITLLRFYPYISSSSNPSSFDASSAPSRGAAGRAPSPASAASPHPTPHVKKVERLIHLELQGMGLRADLGACATCGREHKEWFEVEATRDGVRTVDDIIRRWVGWDDGNLGGGR
ncbi:meiotically up-regulated gene 113 domain-containing protein [Trichoderma chlorosporum]